MSDDRGAGAGHRAASDRARHGRRPSRGLAAALLLAAVTGCGDAAEAPPSEGAGAASPAEAGRAAGRVYERAFAFFGRPGDSLLLVPWIMETTARPDSTVRDARGWLGRAGTWEAFYAERWATPPERVPSRVLPHGDLGIVVRDGDVVDGILFEEGPRSLEIAMEEVIAAWVGPDGETLDLMEGAAYLAEQRVDGVVVDVQRSWREGDPPVGDWLFVTSGDSLRLALAGDVEHGLDREPVYRGWAQRGNQDLVWPDVRVAWTSRQAFPPARRDVPSAWSVDASDGSLSGTLRSITAEIEAGEGPGPLLPVRALIEVEGTLLVDGGRFPVRGLLVHRRR